MTTARDDKNTREAIDGIMNTLKGILLDEEKEKALFQIQWFLDKTTMNIDFEKERALKNEINNIREQNAERRLLIKKRELVTQKNCELPVNIGEIRHIKFGVGVGHELREHHYGIILARKGLMYLTAPLTSKPQDYGKYNYHFDNLGLPSKNGTIITKSHVSFCHIRYIHQRRIEDIRMANKIKKFKIDNEHAIKILEIFFKIINGN